MIINLIQSSRDMFFKSIGYENFLMLKSKTKFSLTHHKTISENLKIVESRLFFYYLFVYDAPPKTYFLRPYLLWIILYSPRPFFIIQHLILIRPPYFKRVLPFFLSLLIFTLSTKTVDKNVYRVVNLNELKQLSRCSTT